MNELLLRLKLPLNTFWSRVRRYLLILGTITAAITDGLPALMNSELVPEGWAQPLKILYWCCYFGGLLVSFTVGDTQELKQEKVKAEFEDKINN